MSATSRVAGAVAAGYLLGRFKKLRLAVLVGTAMASPKFRSAAVGLIQDRIPGGAVVGTVGKDVGGKLLDAGKAAATSVLASRIDDFTESLAHRSENLRKGPNGQASKSRAGDVEDKQSAEAPDDEAYEDEENDVAEEPEDEYEREDSDAAEEPEDEYEDEQDDEAEEPEDEYEQEDSDAAEEQDEYEDEQDDEAEEPEDEYEQENSDAAEEPVDEGTQGAEDEESFDEEPEEEPVTRSPRRRRSASPAGRKRG
jgi:hypothetical protein